MDANCCAILEEYRAHLQSFQKLRETVLDRLNEAVLESGIHVTLIEGRVKSEESLKGKLELKGDKYASLKDITDILGARIVVFYSNDVDRTATVISQLFQVDWDNSGRQACPAGHKPVRLYVPALYLPGLSRAVQ